MRIVCKMRHDAQK